MDLRAKSMSMKLFKKLIIIYFITLSANCISQDKIYNCAIKDVRHASQTGHLISSEYPNNVPIAYIGNLFTINRDNGAMLGKEISTKGASELKVIDSGGDKNNFKVMGIINKFFPTIFFIEINDNWFYKGEKYYSFSGYFMFDHISGICN